MAANLTAPQYRDVFYENLDQPTSNTVVLLQFMADEATDAATMEQMALCLRFYDAEKACLQ
ncbi:hypothetical protein DPMN_053010 [Dreissena polymorpha]|uniref:Uncharacterized protein n=1 Tax=Dreissena polymorpha TaxID=45954 RepID=A0A9D4CKL0_DREPO|nr:hypothetical protein DPMN_053010 [Dreissena polymorpha]